MIFFFFCSGVKFHMSRCQIEIRDGQYEDPYNDTIEMYHSYFCTFYTMAYLFKT